MLPQLAFKHVHIMRKKGDLSDFEPGKIVGARHTGLSKNYSSTVISQTAISRVYKEWSTKEKIFSDQQFSD